MVTARTRRRKWIEPQLDVLLDLHGELVLVGSLALDEDAGNFHASFQYAASYLERAGQQRVDCQVPTQHQRSSSRTNLSSYRS